MLVPARIPIDPVGAIARLATGRLMLSSSENLWDTESLMPLYTDSHWCSSSVTSYLKLRLISHSCMPIKPRPSLRFFSLTSYTFWYGSFALSVPHKRNFVASSTMSLSSFMLSIRPRFNEPKLHTSESSSLHTSVQALRNVSFSLSKKLKLNPGSAVLKACLTFFWNISPTSPVRQ